MMRRPRSHRVQFCDRLGRLELDLGYLKLVCCST
jgi:hypothetical protein